MKFLLTLFLFATLAAKAQSHLALTKNLDSIFQSVIKPDEPGAAVLLVKNNVVIYKKGFGLADIKTKKRVTTKTLFNVGSITKTFVAYGILELARDGKLSLEDDLYKYFPDFKSEKIAKRVKLYHLLTHSSGIPDNRKIDKDSIFYLTAKDPENFAPLKQTEKLNFEPGEQFEYSNPAFDGLALIIEKITEKKWQQYIAETIYRPSGMTHSTITDGPHPETGVAHGYILNEQKEFIEKDYGEEPTFAAAVNGGVWSSVEELWKYEQAIQKNIFLDSSWINKSRKVYPLDNWKDKQPSFMGLSWFLTKQGDLDMIGHTGSQGGFNADYVWLPQKRIFYVLLCNTPKPIRVLQSQVFELLKGNNWLN